MKHNLEWYEIGRKCDDKPKRRKYYLISRIHGENSVFAEVYYEENLTFNGSVKVPHFFCTEDQYFYEEENGMAEEYTIHIKYRDLHENIYNIMTSEDIKFLLTDGPETFFMIFKNDGDIKIISNDGISIGEIDKIQGVYIRDILL